MEQWPKCSLSRVRRKHGMGQVEPAEGCDVTRRAVWVTFLVWSWVLQSRTSTRSFSEYCLTTLAHWSCDESQTSILTQGRVATPTAPDLASFPDDYYYFTLRREGQGWAPADRVWCIVYTMAGCSWLRQSRVTSHLITLLWSWPTQLKIRREARIS